MESAASLLPRHGTHVEEPPAMAIEVEEAMGIHESQVLWLVVGGTSRSERPGHKSIDLLTALTAEVDQDLDRLAGITNRFWRELAKFIMGGQHDKNRVADDNARSIVARHLRIVGKSECLVEGHRFGKVGNRQVEKNVSAHVMLFSIAGKKDAALVVEGLDSQQAAEAPCGIVRLCTVVICEDLAVTPITEEGAAQCSHIVRRRYPT